MKLTTQIALTFSAVCILVFSSLYYAVDEADNSFDAFYFKEISRDVGVTISNVVGSEKNRLQGILLSSAHWSELKRNIEAKQVDWFYDNATGYLLDNEAYRIDFLLMASPENVVIERYGRIPAAVIEKTGLYRRILENPGHLGRDVLSYDNHYYLMEGTSIAENDGSNPEGVFILGTEIDGQISDAVQDSFSGKAKVQVIFGFLEEVPSALSSSDRIKIPYSFWSDGIPSNLPVEVVLRDNVFRGFVGRISERMFYFVLSVSVPAVLILLFYQIKISANIGRGIRQIDIIAQGDYTHRLSLDFSKEFLQLSESVNRLSNELLNRNHQIQMNYVEIITIMIKTIEVSDPYTRGHSERVSHYSVAIARLMGLDDVETVRISGLMHDVGKISIDSNVLNKPGRLTEEEFQKIQQHSETGYKILDGASTFAYTKDIIRYHHEWYNGKGYPSGLAGDEIPMESRIIAVADAFDAMTSDRAYRQAMPLERAIDLIKEGSGTQFDPVVVEAFLPVAEEIYAKWSNLNEVPTVQELLE